MHAEPQAVQIGARVDHSVMSDETTGDIDQRFRRIGYNQNHGVRRHLNQLRRDGLEYPHIGVEKPKPASRIASVGSAASLLVDAGGDDNEARALEVVIIAVLDRNQRRERHAIMHVGRDRSGARSVLVDQHEFAHTGA
jgi:hypothetical protein